MALNNLTEAIEQGVQLIVLSPHLDDAALSCGALMMHAADRTSVIVVTIFTETGPKPYTFSARRYLQQVGFRDAEALYQQRREEDRAALGGVGITCIHAGLPEALFRRRSGRVRSLGGRVLPELEHIYPIYRTHITAGRVAPADARTLDQVSEMIRQRTDSGPSVVLAPLGVGKHVDHILVRNAAKQSGRHVIYYSDFPYNQRHPIEDDFIRCNQLTEMQWPNMIDAKIELVRAYRTQVDALFEGGRIPAVPEIFFSPCG
jgi:LmbE family N-acetylglucosaminyl deacetylase